jgi:hypothetical protein
VKLTVLHGQLDINEFRLRDFGVYTFSRTRAIEAGEVIELTVQKA